MDHKDAHAQSIDHYANVDEVKNQLSLKSHILLWSIVFVLKTHLNFRDALDRLQDQKKEADQKSKDWMLSRVEKEKNKVPHVAFTDASAHPRAVVIVDFYADPAITAVERSWRPKNLACRADRKLLIRISYFYVNVLLLFYCRCN